jgi:hypothetical protein
MKPIGDDIWHVPGPSLRMPGGVMMPLASTVIRLSGGSLVVYSPVRFDDATAGAIDAIGPVEHIIAPNRLHHLHAGAAAARWPRARVHAPAGVRDKQPGLRIDHELGDHAVGDAAWRGAIEIAHIAGAPKIDEYVAFHRPSGTLVCADLVFHINRPANLRSRAVFAMMGVGGGRLAQSRAWSWLGRDRDAARGSLARILAWPIAQIAPCHGEPCAITSAELAPRFTRLAGRATLPLALAAP